MMLEKKKYPLVIGYDLGRKYAQISYSFLGDEPVTVSTVAGTEQFTIPVVLCKKHGVNQWFYGKDAVKKADEGEGILVDDLLELAVKGIPVAVEDDSFEPAALLTLFIKRSLSLLSLNVDYEKAEALTITVKKMDTSMIGVLSSCVNGLALKIKNIYFQSHAESIYHYIVHQPEELWSYQTLVCELSYDGLRTYLMGINKKSVPMVAFMEEGSYLEFDSLPHKNRDTAFQRILEKICTGHLISAVYLVGEGFHGEWHKEALRYLCRNRRVFQGNNLYSKGACYGAGERADGQEDKKLIFLGNEKLKSNVGMRVLRRGEESYFALLDAGNNWFEINKNCEFILESGNSLSFLVTPLTSGEKKEIEMVLEGLVQRPDRTTRLSLDVRPISEKEMSVEIRDLGFGQLFPATDMKWAETFRLE